MSALSGVFGGKIKAGDLGVQRARTFLNAIPASLTDNQDVLQCVAVACPPLRTFVQSSQTVLHLVGRNLVEALFLDVS